MRPEQAPNLLIGVMGRRHLLSIAAMKAVSWAMMLDVAGSALPSTSYCAYHGQLRAVPTSIHRDIATSTSSCRHQPQQLQIHLDIALILS
eukprot:4755388-Amphidinium_carterae.1